MMKERKPRRCGKQRLLSPLQILFTFSHLYIMKTSNSTTLLHDMIISFFSNGISADVIAKQFGKDEQAVRDILFSAMKRYEDADCDDEGATASQEAVMDNIIEETAEAILAL